MRKVLLQDVEDGMVLAKPLTGSSGNVLMGKGIALKASIVPRLAAWGVTSVMIEGEPGPDEVAQAMGENPINATLDKIFEGKLVNRPMEIIFQSLQRYRSRHARD